MSTIHAQLQRGQAMTEFVVAMLVVVPLVLGVVYIGKYEDVKYSAIQASRYAALERVFDPSSAHKNATVLAQETRARFFTDPMQGNQTNQGAVAFKETPPANTKGTINANWLGTGGEPLIDQYSGIKVDVTKVADPNGTNSVIDQGANLEFNLTDPGIQEAHVQVPLAKVAHFAALSNLNLTIDVKTAVLADAYNTGGTKPEADSVKGLILKKVPGLITAVTTIDDVLQPLWQVLSSTPGPQWFCVSPDVVPDAAAPGAPVDYAKNCP